MKNLLRQSCSNIPPRRTIETGAGRAKLWTRLKPFSKTENSLLMVVESKLWTIGKQGKAVSQTAHLLWGQCQGCFHTLIVSGVWGATPQFAGTIVGGFLRPSSFLIETMGDIYPITLAAFCHWSPESRRLLLEISADRRNLWVLIFCKQWTYLCIWWHPRNVLEWLDMIISTGWRN